MASSDKSVEERFELVDQAMSRMSPSGPILQWTKERNELKAQLEVLWPDLREPFGEWWATSSFESEEHRLRFSQARTATIVTALGELPPVISIESLGIYCPELSKLHQEAQQMATTPSALLGSDLLSILDMTKGGKENEATNCSTLNSMIDTPELSSESKLFAIQSMQMIRSLSLLQFTLSTLLIFLGQIEEEESQES
eukprot:CAMPEP_0201491846 /NCGR_PEP_ID=MMETSP0151_2-20130828/31481_1 /ASSEMBLY_ACC=CAM_ASM_000257 /TAXON_ID=200890 /ORGANISM="Paramoeba atlantica, Strain 621/1 / CCAP 1560/9" /LENGTH=197 /DNA_ID=CAMNT_0047878397 /DNA_START=92 /DNA_END=685 /DNA_ORIENTATION=-